jgi:hypothetical protein
VIKVVRELTALGLKEAKDLSTRHPSRSRKAWRRTRPRRSRPPGGTRGEGRDQVGALRAARQSSATPRREDLAAVSCRRTRPYHVSGVF